MKRLLITILSLLFIPITIFGQSSPDTEELTTLLNEFLDGASRNDAEVHDRFWAEDLIYTGSGGRRVGKQEIMDDIRSAPETQPGDPVIRYSAKDIQIQQYDNTAIVAFRLIAKTETDTDSTVEEFLNTGTLLKRNGKWQVVSWQATRKP